MSVAVGKAVGGREVAVWVDGILEEVGDAEEGMGVTSFRVEPHAENIVSRKNAVTNVNMVFGKIFILILTLQPFDDHLDCI